MLGHRGGLRKLESRLGDEAFATQLLCLRLAAIHCHARRDIDTSNAVTLRRQGTEALFESPVGWNDAHPRTLHLLGEEATAWGRVDSLKLAIGPASRTASAAATGP